MTNSSPNLEDAAAAALLRAFGDLLSAQQETQPDAFPAIVQGVGAATELRLEVTMLTSAPRSACIRIVALDGEGSETMLIRSLGLVPPPAEHGS